MQKIISFSVIAVCALLLMTSCNKNDVQYGEHTVITGDYGFLKVNAVSTYAGNPQMTIFVDTSRVSNLITSRSPFPGGGYNTGGSSNADYLAFPSGVHNVRLVLANKALTADSTEIFKMDVTLEAGKYTTLHITDTGANTTAVVLQDDRTRPDSGKIRYRFVNLMPNVPNVALFFGTTKVVNSLAYKADTIFTMNSPTGSTGSWTLKTLAGVNIGTPYSVTSNATFVNSRIYTVFANGYNGPVSPDPRRPFVSFLLNL